MRACLCWFWLVPDQGFWLLFHFDQGVIDVCMAAFSYSAVDRKEESGDQSSPTRHPLPNLLPVDSMNGGAQAAPTTAANVDGVVVGAPTAAAAAAVLVEFGGINRDLFVSTGPGAPEEVFEDEINGGIRREASGGSTDSEVCLPDMSENSQKCTSRFSIKVPRRLTHSLPHPPPPSHP